MVIISDTNILSSFASADALNLLPKLFPHETIHIPPAVIEELQAALDRGQTYVERVFNALSAGEIQAIELTIEERVLMTALPSKLHDGEREGIVICQTRKYPFLSNDRRAVRYCEKNGIRAIALDALLRLLWIRRIISQDEVKALIKTMGTVEDLVLNKTQRYFIFAPRRSRRRRRRKS